MRDKNIILMIVEQFLYAIIGVGLMAFIICGVHFASNLFEINPFILMSLVGLGILFMAFSYYEELRNHQMKISEKKEILTNLVKIENIIQLHERKSISSECAISRLKDIFPIDEVES